MLNCQVCNFHKADLDFYNLSKPYQIKLVVSKLSESGLGRVPGDAAERPRHPFVLLLPDLRPDPHGAEDQPGRPQLPRTRPLLEGGSEVRFVV